MDLTFTPADGITRIAMDRRLDAESVAAAAETLRPLYNGQVHLVVFDFSNTEYIASAGLRVLLVAARKIAENGGKVALCSLSPQVQKVFEIGGFTRIFPIAASRDEAAALLRG